LRRAEAKPPKALASLMKKMRIFPKILSVIIIIVGGISILWIPALLLVGYQKITEWIFGDWDFIESPVILLFLIVGFFAIFFWFINKVTRK